MRRDRYEPPPELSEEELRRWQQWRKFTWLPGDIVIAKRGGSKEPGISADGERDDERPGDEEAR